MEKASMKKRINGFTIIIIFGGIIIIACIALLIYPQLRIRINTENVVSYRIGEFSMDKGITERSHLFEEEKEIDDVSKIINEFQSKGFAFYNQFTDNGVLIKSGQDLKNLDIQVEYSNGQSVYYRLFAEGKGINIDARMTINFDRAVSEKFYNEILKQMRDV